MSIDAVSGATNPTDLTSLAGAAGAAAATGAPDDALGRNVFLQLLVTQLKNQDPLEPQDNSAFLAQLAQFSSLEQLQTISANTTTLLAALQGTATPLTTVSEQ